MSLRSKFVVDSKLVSDGVWFAFEPNPDGSVPEFKLAFMGPQHTRYTEAARRWNATYLRDADDPVKNETEAEKALLQVFADTVLVDWRCFQPNEDGVPLAYCKEAVIAIFGSPDWYALYEQLNMLARNMKNYQNAARSIDAKN